MKNHISCAAGTVHRHGGKRSSEARITRILQKKALKKGRKLKTIENRGFFE